jgi:hypothetical protein
VSAPRLLAALGLAALIAPAAGAQGLGDVAARERESREKGEKKPGMAPVFTNDDLDVYRPPGSEDQASESEVSDEDEAESSRSSSASETEGSEGERFEPRGVDTAPQTEAVNRAQAEVDSITRRIRELNDRLNPMSMNYVYGAAASGDAAGEEIRIRNELSGLQERLVEARAELARAHEALSAARQGPRSRPVEPQ